MEVESPSSSGVCWPLFCRQDCRNGDCRSEGALSPSGRPLLRNCRDDDWRTRDLDDSPYLLPSDESDGSILACSVFDGGCNSANHQFVSEVAVVGLGKVWQSALAQNGDAPIIKFVDEAAVIVAGVLPLLIGPIDVEVG